MNQHLLKPYISFQNHRIQFQNIYIYGPTVSVYMFIIWLSDTDIYHFNPKFKYIRVDIISTRNPNFNSNENRLGLSFQPITIFSYFKVRSGMYHFNP